MSAEPDLVLEPPTVGDGAAMWALAGEVGLDQNTPYAYLLWCRDFARTSIVARAGSSLAGYVTGYLRPAAPGTLFIWQVTTSPDHRGRGIAGRMLDALATSCGATAMEATVTPSNDASHALFAAFARSRGVGVDITPLFAADDFPRGDHEAEDLVRIGPWIRADGT